MRYFCLGLLCFLFADCNKKIDVNANTAFISVTNVAPGSPALTAFFDGNSLIPFGNLPYDSSTSVPGHAYPDSAIGGVHLLEVKDGASDIISGLTAFQKGSYYSIFFFDSTSTNKTLKTFIFQDNLSVPADSLCYLRFINFSPAPLDSLLNLALLNVSDTFHTANDTVYTGYRTYAGNNINPGGNANANAFLLNQSGYSYILIKGGLFHAQVLDNDSSATVLLTDTTLYLLGGKSYTIYLEGYRGATGSDAMKIKTLLHN